MVPSFLRPSSQGPFPTGPAGRPHLRAPWVSPGLPHQAGNAAPQCRAGPQRRPSPHRCRLKSVPVRVDTQSSVENTEWTDAGNFESPESEM